MRRLLPAPATDVTVDEAYRAPLGRREPPGRPWVGLCMVSSLDGSTVVDGDSGALSSENDSAVLHRLRSLADVVVVGAGTVRAEGYGPPKRADQRIGVVTGSGRVDTTLPLFTSGAGFLITTERADVGEASAAGVEVLRAGTDSVDLALAIGHLDEVAPGCAFVQAEGGARLNAALAEADVLDEINLTVSPGVVGGDGPRVTAGAIDLSRTYELAQLVVDDGSFVFTRWRRR